MTKNLVELTIDVSMVNSITVPFLTISPTNVGGALIMAASCSSGNGFGFCPSGAFATSLMRIFMKLQLDSLAEVFQYH